MLLLMEIGDWLNGKMLARASSRSARPALAPRGRHVRGEIVVGELHVAASSTENHGGVGFR
jgi:hypothetical protein